MAGNSVVGALRVTLGLDSAQFSTGLKSAQSGLQKFGALAKQGAIALAGALAVAGGAMAVAMRGVVDQADEMTKLSAAIGVPIEDLSKLGYAADLAGIDMDTLGKAVKRLSAGMLDASMSATAPAAKAFEMLGISIKDAEGNMRPAMAVIEDLATRFQRMPNGVEKTAIAMKLFGKSGADLIPLLNAGGDGLREMYQEAQELGIVLDQETGAAAEQFNDNLTRLDQVKNGLVTTITSSMLPALAGMTDGLVIAAKNSNTLRGVGAGLGNVLRFLATAAVTAGGFFLALAQDIKTTAQVAYLWSTQQYTAAVAVADDGDRRRRQTLASINAINTAIWSPPAGGRNTFEQTSDSLNELEDSSGRARRSVSRLSDAQKEAQKAAADLAREQERLADDLKRDGERTFEETRTAAERYQMQIERLRRQLAAAAIDQDTFNRAMKSAGNDLADATRVDVKIKPKVDEFAEIQAEIARDQREELEAATYDGIRGGLEAAADGNLGAYLAQRIRSALLDRLAGVLTDGLLGTGQKGSTGGWLSAAGSMLKGKIPGFSKGIENFGGGLAYVHKGEVLANLPKGTSVIPAKSVGGPSQGVTFVLNSPVMTEDLLRQMESMAANAQAGAVRQSTEIVRRSSAGMQQRQRRLGTV